MTFSVRRSRSEPRAARGVLAVESLEPRRVMAAFVPDDPLFLPGTAAGAASGYYGQWQLDNRMPGSADNAGLDAAVAGAWSRGLTGTGVTIGFLDDGVQGNHPDLSASFRNDVSWDFSATQARNLAATVRGSPVVRQDKHGTAVAGVAAARGGNGIGMAGAAPAAGIASLRMLGSGRYPGGRSEADVEAAAILYQGQRDTAGRPNPYLPVDWSGGVPVRVKNHSYGPAAAFSGSVQVDAALDESARRGVIHVVAAGNERDEGPTADANKSGLDTNPNVIVVAALGSDGRYASYSSYGANVFVTAPSSSFSTWDLFSIPTTDRSTSRQGYTSDPGAPDPYLASVSGGDYTSAFGGTSSSAPLISGVMALGVEANRYLGVRMAKHLLAETSVRVDPGNPSWQTNAAGYGFSDDYGFGLIDADAFTEHAARVTSLTSAVTYRSPVIAVAAPFTPAQTSLTTTYTLPAAAGMQPLETVRVRLDVGNLQTNPLAYRNGNGRGRGAISGDLEAFLTSPSGTRHRLFSDDRFLLGTEYRSERQRFLSRSFDWTFTSNAYWGESAAGTWTLDVLNKANATQLIGRSGVVNDVTFAFDTGSITLAPPGTVGAAPNPGGTEGYVMNIGGGSQASAAARSGLAVVGAAGGDQMRQPGLPRARGFSLRPAPSAAVADSPPRADRPAAAAWLAWQSFAGQMPGTARRPSRPALLRAAEAGVGDVALPGPLS